MWRTKTLALLLITLAVGPVAAGEDAPPTIIASKFEFFVSDPHKSAAFYAVLGIAVTHRKASGYTTLQSGSTVIALSPVPWWLPVSWLGFLRYPPIGTEIVLYTTRLEYCRAAFSKAGYSPGEIVLQAWGDRDFRIVDPDGYYIRVSEGVAVPLVQSFTARQNAEDGP